MPALAILLDQVLPPQLLKSFDFANDLTKQLITLAIAILTITITFTKDIFKGDIGKNRKLLTYAWVTLFVSIITGIWEMMALTGELVAYVPGGDVSVLFSSARLPAMLQILSFLAGVFMVILFAIHGVAQLGKKADE